MKDFLDIIVQSYESGYDTLIEDLVKTSDEALDWKVTPEAITIGSSVLHIVGYELMLVAALEGADIRCIRERPDWPQYERGFPKELDTPTPSGLPLTHYLTMIETRRNDTRRFWRESALGLLGGQTLFYKDGHEFKESGLEMEANNALLTSFLGHVRYHRGQLTLLRYLFSVHNKVPFLKR